MLRMAVVTFLGLMVVCQSVARGEVNAVEAFEAHAKLMTGGVWVSTDKDGKVVVDRHVPSKSKKFIQVRSVVGDEYAAGILGVDPESRKLKLWSFREDGAVGVWTCTKYEDGRWTWEGQTVGLGGKESGKAVAIKVNDNELKLVIEGDGDQRIENVWKRR